MKEIEFILYVANQEKSSYYYQQLLEIIPSLNVPGMTEFELTDGVKLGLMPEDGIAKIVTDKAPHPKLGNGIPRCELYLKVKNAAEFLKRGVLLGGKEISELKIGIGEIKWGLFLIWTDISLLLRKVKNKKQNLSSIKPDYILNLLKSSFPKVMGVLFVLNLLTFVRYPNQIYVRIILKQTSTI